MAGTFRRAIALRPVGHLEPSRSLADLFHENTKHQRATITPARERYSGRELEAMARAYKRYRLHPQIALPSVPPESGGGSYDAIVVRRRSAERIGTGGLELRELAVILGRSYGITGEMPIPGGGTQLFRASPSAGALYPAEIYLAVRSVDGLEPGIYHYEVTEHSLALLEGGDLSDRISRACCGQAFATEAAVVLFITGVIERTRRKYGDRGYRYVLIDVGHLGQSICLASTALNLAAVTSCGFFDDEVAEILGVDGCEEAPLYLVFIGRPVTGSIHATT